MRKIILSLLLLTAYLSNAQYKTVSMTGSNASAFGTEGTIGTDGATYYVHWDNTYLYLGWSGGRTNYSSDMYYAAIDTDPNTTNGVTSTFNGVNFTSGSGSRKPDYLIFYENNSSFHGAPVGNGNAFERWGNSSNSWAFLNRFGGNDGVNSRVDFQESTGEVRVRIAWSDLGNPTRGADKPIAITMWTNNPSAADVWGSFPGQNPTGAPTQTMTHSFIFYNTGDGVNPSTSYVIENNTFTTSDLSGTQTLGITISGNRSITAATQFSSNLNILSGSSLSIGSNTLTLASTITGSGSLVGGASSNLTMNGTGGVGTLNFSQSSDGTSNHLNNLTLNRTSGSVTLSNKLFVGNTLTLTDGTLNTGGNLHLRSTSTNTARIAEITGTGAISGNVTVERYISANSNRAWRLLTPGVNTSTSIRANWMEGTNNTDLITNNDPVPGFGTHITGSNGTTNGFDQTQTNAASLYFYNQAGQSWSPVGSTTTGTDIATMNAKTGYLLFVRGDRSNISRINATASSSNTVLRATGTLLTGTQTFPGLATDGNFSLITNPYASPIRWDASSGVYTGANATNFENYYTIWEPNVSTRGGFVTVNSSGTVGGASLVATRDIQSGQAFFVKTKSGVMSAPTFTINESNKTTVNNIDIFRLGTQQESLKAYLFFTHTDNSRRVADGVTTVYDNNFSAGFDGNDAEQIANWDEDIAIVSNSKQLSIESRPLADAGDTIFFNMARLREINYEWEFKAENFNAPGLTAYLQDAFTGTETAISLAGTTVVPFTVTSNAASKAANRFRIVYRGTATLPVTLTSVKAFQQNSGITVSWNTQNESGIQQYEVEQSTNGNNFNKVNTTVAKNGTANSYSWFDASPVQGNNYYRIKAISLNGEVKYSNIVVVKLGGKGNDISVYPNPVKGNTISLSLNGLSKGNYTMSVFNQLGQQVLNRVINHNGGNATQTVDLSSLATGIYELRLSNGQTVLTEKLVKE